MAMSKLSALRITDPRKWAALIQSALKTAGSIPEAAVVLTAKGFPTTRAVLLTALRKHPAELLVPGIELPPAKGLERGQPRQDKRPGWKPSEATLARRTRRATKRAKTAGGAE